VPGDGGLNFLLVDLGPAFGATMATMASPKSACGTPMTVGTRNGFNGRFDGGIDVIATRNDEVLGASGNVDVAFRIDIAEVAGDENAVEQASKSLGDLRIAEIVELDMQLDANGKSKPIARRSNYRSNTRAPDRRRSALMGARGECAKSALLIGWIIAGPGGGSEGRIESASD
jgi:hypothetical protein